MIMANASLSFIYMDIAGMSDDRLLDNSSKI